MGKIYIKNLFSKILLPLSYLSFDKPKRSIKQILSFPCGMYPTEWDADRPECLTRRDSTWAWAHPMIPPSLALLALALRLKSPALRARETNPTYKLPENNTSSRRENPGKWGNSFWIEFRNYSGTIPPINSPFFFGWCCAIRCFVCFNFETRFGTCFSLFGCWENIGKSFFILSWNFVFWLASCHVGGECVVISKPVFVFQLMASFSVYFLFSVWFF